MPFDQVAGRDSSAPDESLDDLGLGQAVTIGQVGALPPPLRPAPITPTRRFTGSAWAMLREGVAAGLAGGQLGGSQVGLRTAYALDPAQRVAVVGRVSAPLGGQGAEAAAGIELRPARLPLRVIAEQRLALDGGRDRTAIYAVGGTAPVPVAAGFRLEAYAQAGVIVRGGARGFADGAARLTRPVEGSVDLGVGIWGGTQPGVSRVDIGPTLGVVLPVARRSVRLSLDWRQRVAGRARPGSGPALSIGSDF